MPTEDLLRRANLLANPEIWTGLGKVGQLLWGTAQGFLAAFDKEAQRSRCECGADEDCRHTLALQILYTKNPECFDGNQTLPSMLSAWANVQPILPDAPQKAIFEAPEIPSEPLIDKKALDKEKRRQERLSLMQDGMNELQIWLSDIAQNGLAVSADNPESFWERASARMVDAKLPGISYSILEMSAPPRYASDKSLWLFRQVGRLKIIQQAFFKIQELPKDVADDLIYSVIGVTIQKKEVIEIGEAIGGQWRVLGIIEDYDLRGLPFRKVWLLQPQTYRTAFLLDFAFGKQPYEHTFTVGESLEANISYYPSALPARATLKEIAHLSYGSVSLEAQFSGVTEALQHVAERLGILPWLHTHALSIKDLQVIREQEEYFAVDTQGHALPIQLTETQYWQLYAMQLQEPLSIFGEWNGLRFKVLSAWGDGFVGF